MLNHELEYEPKFVSAALLMIVEACLGDRINDLDARSAFRQLRFEVISGVLQQFLILDLQFVAGPPRERIQNFAAAAFCTRLIQVQLDLLGCKGVRNELLLEHLPIHVLEFASDEHYLNLIFLN